jgi:hypothetical protein
MRTVRAVHAATESTMASQTAVPAHHRRKEEYEQQQAHGHRNHRGGTDETAAERALDGTVHHAPAEVAGDDTAKAEQDVRPPGPAGPLPRERGHHHAESAPDERKAAEPQLLLVLTRSCLAGAQQRPGAGEYQETTADRPEPGDVAQPGELKSGRCTREESTETRRAGRRVRPGARHRARVLRRLGRLRDRFRRGSGGHRLRDPAILLARSAVHACGPRCSRTGRAGGRTSVVRRALPERRQQLRQPGAGDGIDGQAPAQEVAQRLRHAGKVGRLVHPPRDGDVRRPGERQVRRRGVHQQDPEREHVARRGHRPAVELLGREVADRPQPHPGTGQRGTDVGDPNDPEIDHPRAVGGHEDVGRLEVAVHQVDGVDCLQRLGETGAQRVGAVDVERPLPVDHLVQRGGIDVGARVPRRVADGVTVDDRRGVEATDALGRLDLVPEAGAKGGVVVEQVRVDDLHRDLAAAGRAAEVDLPHPARTQAADQGERPEPNGVPSRVERLHGSPPCRDVARYPMQRRRLGFPLRSHIAGVRADEQQYGSEVPSYPAPENAT